MTKERGEMMSKTVREERQPEYRNVTDFLRGQASKIFKSIKENDETVFVTNHGKPTAVIISYDRYAKLKYKDKVDI